jgi:hypothetical protein
MSALPLAAQRCLYHAAREAVARCPECGSSYCRECIAEHEGRIICATCLQRLLHKPAEARRPFGRLLAWTAGSVAGLLLAWMSFYGFGRLLMTLPSAFHAAEMWTEEMTGKEE